MVRLEWKSHLWVQLWSALGHGWAGEVRSPKKAGGSLQVGLQQLSDLFTP